MKLHNLAIKKIGRHTFQYKNSLGVFGLRNDHCLQLHRLAQKKEACKPSKKKLIHYLLRYSFGL